MADTNPFNKSGTFFLKSFVPPPPHSSRLTPMAATGAAINPSTTGNLADGASLGHVGQGRTVIASDRALDEGQSGQREW